MITVPIHEGKAGVRGQLSLDNPDVARLRGQLSLDNPDVCYAAPTQSSCNNSYAATRVLNTQSPLGSIIIFYNIIIS